MVVRVLEKRKVKRARIRQPLDPSIRYIPLTQGQKATVDAEDYEWLMQWNWSAKWDDCTQSYYARRRVQVGDGFGGSCIGMHNVLKGAFGGIIVDHEDGDTLNMRKTNLRIATPGQNAWNHPTRKDNRLGVKGVRQKGNRFEVRIAVNGQRECKTFTTVEEALIWRYQAAAEKHGEFRRVA
jgi:hypothetical protein